MAHSDASSSFALQKVCWFHIGTFYYYYYYYHHYFYDKYNIPLLFCVRKPFTKEDRVSMYLVACLAATMTTTAATVAQTTHITVRYVLKSSKPRTRASVTLCSRTHYCGYLRHNAKANIVLYMTTVPM